MNTKPITILWAAKGGSGTSTIAATIALTDPRNSLLVDLDGELPAVLGLPEPSGDGISEWFSTDAEPALLDLLTVEINRTTRLIPHGHERPEPSPQRWAEFGAWAANHGPVVIDAGTRPPPPSIGATNLLVTRACYLSLRRAVATPLRPDGVILVTEPGRAIKAPDVERALGVPVVAQIATDPAVARAIDAGLLAARAPKALRNAVAPLTPTPPTHGMSPDTDTSNDTAAQQVVHAWQRSDSETSPEPPPLDIA
jgi:hypothetical protein